MPASTHLSSKGRVASMFAMRVALVRDRFVEAHQGRGANDIGMQKDDEPAQKVIVQETASLSQRRSGLPPTPAIRTF